MRDCRYRIVTDLPLIVWELITEYRYRLRNPRNHFLTINCGITVADLNFSELITVRITVTDADFFFLKFDW